jgi:DNA invertase Pin-like site-specific DNA recombinase
MQYIAYLRVSTDKQGRSGLGLAAQRKALEPYDVISEYEEVESGRNNARPQLALALADAKRRGCGLVIAKLDRLARNVHFVSGLLESGVPIVCADMPEADRTMLHMMAVFAEWEARRIGERTREALAAAKARGVKLGSPRPEEGGRKTGAARRARTDAAAVRAWPVIQRLADRGASSREISSMKTIIVCGVMLTATASLIIVDFGRRVIECRESNDVLSERLADIDQNYFFFPKEPGGN